MRQGDDGLSAHLKPYLSVLPELGLLGVSESRDFHFVLEIFSENTIQAAPELFLGGSRRTLILTGVLCKDQEPYWAGAQPEDSVFLL